MTDIYLFDIPIDESRELETRGFWVTPEMMVVTVSPPLENTNFTRSQDLPLELREAITRMVRHDE